MKELQLTDSRTRKLLLAQFDMAWALAQYHLQGLTTEECLWAPAQPCIHVRQDGDKWRADWPDTEGYEIGPPSIAWTTWHICFWWTKAIGHMEGNVSINAEDVSWPGDADRVRSTIQSLHDRWRALIESTDDAGFQRTREDSWPLPDSSFDSIAAWLNVELMKNAAEIGVVRFLHAVSSSSHRNH